MDWSKISSNKKESCLLDELLVMECNFVNRQTEEVVHLVELRLEDFPIEPERLSETV